MEDNAEVAQVIESTVNEEVNNDGMQEGQEATQEVKIEAPKDEPLPKGVQKRIDRAVRQKYEAEANSRVLEERIRMLEQGKGWQQLPKEAEAPRLDQYDNIEDYVKAAASYMSEKLLDEKLSAREKAENERHAQTAQGKAEEVWQKRITTMMADMPDYNEVIKASDIVFKDPVVSLAIKESDIGPRIAYYLATHEDEADEIAELTGIAAVRAIGRLEVKLQGKSVATTRTPAPISPVGQKAKVEKSPEEMSSKEFAAWRKGFISNRGSR